MASKIEILNHYLGEIQKLKAEIKNYKTTNEYVYRNVMERYASRYNKILKKYYESSGIPLETFKIFEYELSSTLKTVRNVCVDRFLITIDTTIKLIEEQIEIKRNETISKDLPIHQMRKCLKLDIVGCPKNPKLNTNKVFVGMPFDDKYLDSYEYGIKIALQSCGFESFKANENISNMDIMCKICEQMQVCKYLIFNISGLNPNVMLELGLSYGLGKETIIVKNTETKTISDIANIEYLEYSHARELQTKLVKYFESH